MRLFIKLLVLVALCLFLISPLIYPYSRHHNSYSHSSHSSKSGRVHSGTGSHTRSHEGYYKGGHGSSHKGGHYKNSGTHDHYRKHK